MSLRESREKPPITMICMNCNTMSRHIPEPNGNICDECGSALIPMELYKKTTQYQIDELATTVSKLLRSIKDDISTPVGAAFLIFWLIGLEMILIFVK